MSVGFVMTICEFAIRRHQLAIPARTAVRFGLATFKSVSPNYPFIWSRASGCPAELLNLQLAELKKFTIEEMLTLVSAAVSCHAIIVERSYGGK